MRSTECYQSSLGHTKMKKQISKNKHQQNTPIIVGTVDNNLPCSDKIDDHLEGYSIDVWRRIRERLNIDYRVITSKTYDEAVMLAAKGKVDIVASCHDITPERLQLVAWPLTMHGVSLSDHLHVCMNGKGS